MLRKMLNLIIKSIKDLHRSLLFYLSVNAGMICTAFEFLTLFAAFEIGRQSSSGDVGNIISGISAALISFILIKFLRKVIKEAGIGDEPPVPAKRFTEVSNDGMVSVDNARLQELLIYVSDLEMYFERKGLLE